MFPEAPPPHLRASFYPVHPPNKIQLNGPSNCVLEQWFLCLPPPLIKSAHILVHICTNTVLLSGQIIHSLLKTKPFGVNIEDRYSMDSRKARLCLLVMAPLAELRGRCSQACAGSLWHQKEHKIPSHLIICCGTSDSSPRNLGSLLKYAPLSETLFISSVQSVSLERANPVAVTL